MYTPNHAMLQIKPPHGTQLIGHVDGSYMFIFDRSLKLDVVGWLTALTLEANDVSPVTSVVSSSGTSTAPVQGKVLKGDVTFEFATTKLDETVHIDAEVAESMAAANKRGQHSDTEKPPPPTEPNNEIPSLEV